MVLTVIVFFGSILADGPAVILVSIDGFRWDYLNRGASPNLAGLIESGISAPCMHSQITQVSLASQT